MNHPSIKECKVAHIVHTGFHAGLPWCRISAAANPDHGFAHLGLWVDNPKLRSKLCPTCRELLESDGE